MYMFITLIECHWILNGGIVTVKNNMLLRLGEKIVC